MQEQIAGRLLTCGGQRSHSLGIMPMGAG
jgi:hypothetical protein